MNIWSITTRSKGEQTMKKQFKRLTAIFIAMVLAISAMTVSSLAVDANEIKQTDVYLVLDNSKSMKNTDPEKLLDTAVSQFFNSTTLGSSVGVIMYCGEVQSVSSLQGKKLASDLLGSYTYDQTGSGTNIGEALTVANEHLASGSNPNKAIVLITDGADNGGIQYNIVSNGSVIPVYCVYINDGTNSEEETSKTYLSKVAQDSGTGNYYEISNDGQIETIMDEICRKIYGTTLEDGDIHDVEANGSIDVPYEIQKDVYMASGTITHTDAVSLKITDPSGTVIYDAADPNLSSGNDILSIEAGKSVTSINMLWPDAGTYTFTVSSEIAQSFALQMITISSGIDLSLDTDTVETGGSVKATCKTTDGDSIIQNAYARVHDSEGHVVSNDIPMTDNGDGSFSADIDLSQFGEGDKCFVVAVAETNDGRTLASNKQNVDISNVEDPKAVTKSGSDNDDSGFPIWIIPIIIVILIVIVVVVLKNRGKTPSGPIDINVSPLVPISVRIFGANGKGLLVYVNLQSVDIPEGKESELYDAIAKRAQDINLIPEEIKSLTVDCTAPSDRTADQTLGVNIYKLDDPDIRKDRKTLVKGKQRELRIRLDSGDEIQFQWAGTGR